MGDASTWIILGPPLRLSEFDQFIADFGLLQTPFDRLDLHLSIF
jgi:hypothetical protein